MIEIKSVSSSGFNLRSLDEKGLFSGYASVFDCLDDHNDIVLPGSFRDSLENYERQNKWPKMLWQHNLQEPIGRWLFMEEDEKGLYVEGQLLLDLQKGKEAYTLMKVGAVDGLSIGFQVEKSKRDPKTGLRYIQQVKLIEISIVTYAANQEARVMRVKKG